MIRKVTLLLLILMSSVGPAQASQLSDFDISSLGERSRQAYHKLSTAEVFRLGRVGYAGVTSDEEISLRILLRERKAIEVMESLVNGASPEGKLYGLLGLRLKNKAAYQRALSRLKSSGGPPGRNSRYGVVDISKAADGKIPEVGSVPQGEVVTESGDLVERVRWQEVLAAIHAGRYDKLLRRR